jgi:hypothetical protein
MFITYYIICIIYCFYQLFKNLNKRYDNTPSGGSPEMDTIMVIVMAWILAPIDISLTWIRWVKEAEEARRRQTSTTFLDADTFRNEETHIY